MPTAICDSEDEDEILLDDGPSQRSTYSAHIALANSILDDPNLNGANDQQPASTTSSELRREIMSAQQALCATAAERSLSTPAMGHAHSITVEGNKRRRTTVVGSEPAASPPKSTRRSKTSNASAYDKNRTTLAEEGEHLAATREGDQVPNMSQSPRFSDHSGGQSPTVGLAAGTIGEDFINHDPNVMFKDTGSTNAFNESSQQRLVEQALQVEQNVQPSAEKPAGSGQRQQSSSFPWSASADPTQSAEKDKSKAPPDHAAKVDSSSESIAVTAKQPASNPSPSMISEVLEKLAVPTMNKPANVPEKQRSNGYNSGISKESDSEIRVAPKAHPPKSSPIVEIPRYHPSQDDEEAEAPKPTRGRKRKAQEEVDEPMNSDEIAIGLPKENYKPRPSRRRATAVLEEPVDYSMVPEKAAKRRRKTIESKDDASTIQAEGSEKAASEASQTATEQSGATNGDQQEEGDRAGRLAEAKISDIQQPASQQSDEDDLSKKDAASMKKSNDAMLMKPPALPASASKKSRRSKTTIFEDHVDFNRSSKSPTLSQQQASRMSALAEMQNDAKSEKRAKKRRIVQDEDDEDEDELAKDTLEKEEEAPPKKRGRPAKAKSTKAKSKEKVLEDSDAEEDELAIEVEEPPKKAGRGKAKKATKANEPSKEKGNANEFENEIAHDAENESGVVLISSDKDTAAQSSTGKAALQRKDSNASGPPKEPDTTGNQGKAPLPSPQKSPAKPASTTTHSPIKTGTFANYRVGLSKRSRIPSLLKSFRAPAPPRR